MFSPILEKIENNVPNQIDKNFIDLKQPNPPVYFYGAGIAGKNVKKSLEDDDIFIDSVIIDEDGIS